MTPFRAEWPILDRSLTDAELIAEAEADLPRLRPEGMCLRRKRWTVSADKVTLQAQAAKYAVPRTLSAEPLLTYVRHRMACAGTFAETDQRVLIRAAETGDITERLADRFACHTLRVHPALIWGDEWFEGLV